MGAALCCRPGDGATTTNGGAATGSNHNNNNTINENKRRKVKRTIQMIALGVQDAGKTHAIKLLKGEPPKDLTSSVGFSSHSFQYDKGFDVGVYDVGGGSGIRNIWYNYLAECHAVIFIVNLQDMSAATIDESADLLKDLAAREDVHGKPIMLVLNRPAPGFDEIEFVARITESPLQLGLHEPPFNVDQRFHIARMHNYDGYLDHQKPSSSTFVVREKKCSDPLLESFRSFVDKVVSEFVLLDVGVKEAQRRLEERVIRDKAARAARAAQREQEERDRATGVQETAMDEPPEAAAVAVEADHSIDQPGPSGIANQAFEVDGAAGSEATSPISRQFEDDNISSDVFMPPSREPSIQSASLHPPRPLPHPPGETGILGELSPQPERPAPVTQQVPPTPAPRKISNASTTTIFVDSRTTLKLSRMERIQKGIQSRTKPKEPILNGHVNTAYLPEVA
ncbi:arl-13 [Pristionchus pacificus]|uniref:ADP ribosylation factor n=1 Tax=Pristionchus pacificus TaxID=54126 RepID=A0A2A6BUY3_PRIPA|nr:arl-13 [Pristionchus pacificus]|eukprot:PDM69571.1 ADP ribosylation factor [Pristionchus pacificus]